MKNFFNTIGLTSNSLKKADKKAKSQNQIIFEYLIKNGKASASQLFNKQILGKHTPLTSYRRALTTLCYNTPVRKTDIKIMGIYGKFEYIYSTI